MMLTHVASSHSEQCDEVVERVSISINIEQPRLEKIHSYALIYINFLK